MKRWYAIRVMTGMERDVCRALEPWAKTISPERTLLRRAQGAWRETQRAAYTGYCFMQALQIELPQLYRLLKETPGVIDVAGREGAAFHAIPPEQMEIVLLLQGAGSGVSHARRLDGGQYEITDGPLAAEEMRRRIVRIDIRDRRATVALPFMRETKMIDLAVAPIG